MLKTPLVSKKGFTLVELLVVIAIIGVLSTLAFSAFKGAQLKSRDAKRLSDLNAVRSALDMYYSYNHFYPTFITALQPIKNDTGKVYLDSMPTNPQPRTDHGCADTDYVYTPGQDNKSYSLTACVGNSNENQPKTVSAMNSGVFHCGDTVTDRDGYEYPSVQINSQCWMGANLKTKTWPNGEALTMGSTASERDCITTDNQRGTEDDCQARGALYAATVSSSICPSGWHIPSDSELATLEKGLTDAGQSCNSNRGWSGGGVCLMGNPHADGCEGSGQKLKNGGSTNFNWTLIGARDLDNQFFDAGTMGYLLSSTPAFCGMGGTGIAVRAVSNEGNGIQRTRFGFSSFVEDPGYSLPAMPIRCIKD